MKVNKSHKSKSHGLPFYTECPPPISFHRIALTYQQYMMQQSADEPTIAKILYMLVEEKSITTYNSLS